MQKNNSTFLKHNVFPTMLLTEQGEIIETNEKFYKLFNIPAKEFIQKPVLEVFKLNTPNNERYALERLIESQVFAHLTIQKYDKIPVQLSISSIDESKLITVIVTKDENEHFNSGTFDSLNQLNFAIEGANIGTWQYDINTHQVFFSPVFRQLINLPKPIKMLYWKKFVTLIYPDDQEIFAAFIKYQTTLNSYDFLLSWLPSKTTNIGKSSALFPEKRITSVYVTHPYSDHIAGLATFTKIGAVILADAYSIEAIRAYPRFKKDLATFKFQTIENDDLIEGVRFYVLENSRAKRQSFAYFEDKGIIYQSDFLEVPFDNTIPQILPSYSKTFIDFVRSKQLKVDRIVGHHRNNNISLNIMNKLYDSNRM